MELSPVARRSSPSTAAVTARVSPTLTASVAGISRAAASITGPWPPTTLIRAEAAIARRAASPTARPRAPGVIRVIAVSLRANGDRSALHLDAAPLLLLGRIHAVALREILADGVGAHGRIFNGEPLCLEACIALVLAIVDAGRTDPASAASGGGEEGGGPLPAEAEI